jgi:hypothetical protein
VFAAKTVGGVGTKMTSRRYDIEFRTQYFYYQDGGEIVKAAVKVPMLFVQEEQLSSLESDLRTTNASNGVSAFSLTVSAAIQSKIKSDYAVLIDAFILVKDTVSVDVILEWIGEKR